MIRANCSSATVSSRIARALVGLVAFGVYLVSGLLIAFSLVMMPRPGSETPLLLTKLVGAGAWALIGLWLVRDWYHLRLRVLLPPVFAWLLAWLLLQLIASTLMYWGY
jgi:hypothetical protein